MRPAADDLRGELRPLRTSNCCPVSPARSITFQGDVRVRAIALTRKLLDAGVAGKKCSRLLPGCTIYAHVAGDPPSLSLEAHL